MAEFPFMRFYVGDYDAKTAHLTLEEDGAYNRLLRLCWQTSGCSIPDDPKWIARHMRVSIETYHDLVDPIIKEFFRRENGRIFQKRQREEWHKARELSDKRAAAGRIGGQKSNTLKTNETASSKSAILLKQSESYPYPELERKTDSVFSGFLDGRLTDQLAAMPDLQQRVSEWQDSGLAVEDIAGVIGRVLPKARKPVKLAAYFNEEMHRLSCRKAGFPELPRTRARSAVFSED